MAAIALKSTMQALQSKLRAMGNVYEAVIAEPSQPFTAPAQTKRVAAAVWFVSWLPTLTLATSVEGFILNVRLHVDAFAKPQEEHELALTDTFSEFTTDIQQDYTLGGVVREIDIAGQFTDGMSAEAGRITLSDKMYRIIDITVPVIVNDVATHAP